MLMSVLLLSEFQFASRSAISAHRVLTVSSTTLDAALAVLVMRLLVISIALLPLVPVPNPFLSPLYLSVFSRSRRLTEYRALLTNLLRG
jgi:hypothetical protein